MGYMKNLAIPDQQAAHFLGTSMSRKEAIRALAKDFVKFVSKEDNKEAAFDAWYSKLQTDLAKQIQYELEQINENP